MSFAVRHAQRVAPAVARGARAYATPSSSSSSFAVTEQGGVKVASTDFGSPTSTISVVVKAGSRYEPQPGLSHVLKHSLFKKTNKRSAIRLVRETEMLGGVLSTSLSREHLVLTADFLKGDEGYFAEILGEAVTQAKFAAHEFNEEVVPAVAAEYEQAIHNSSAYALDLAHSLAFRTGLGNSLYASPHTAVDYNSAISFARSALSPSNISVLGAGIDASSLKQLVSQHFTGGSAGGASLSNPSSSYFGGEVRVNNVDHTSGLDTFLLGFKGASSSSVELDVLRHVLGGESSLKWSAGASPLSQIVASNNGVASARAFNLSYSDAGLFGILINAPSSEVTSVAKAAVGALKKAAQGVEGDALKRAIAKAKFAAASALESRVGSLELAGSHISNNGSAPALEEIFAKLDKVSADSVAKAAAEALKSKPTGVAVGNTRTAPYIDQLGF